MNKTSETLIGFIAAAEKSRKYPINTASGYRSAVRLFELEMNEDEQSSVDVFKERFERIYQVVVNKNLANYTAGSLLTYKKRVQKVLSDYEAYGKDPTKMSQWTPKEIVRRPKKLLEISKPVEGNILDAEEVLPDNTSSRLDPHTIRFELPLRPNAKVLIVAPADLTVSEVDKIKAYIEYLRSIAHKDPVN